jgi:hypothetical protein
MSHLAATPYLLLVAAVLPLADGCASEVTYRRDADQADSILQARQDALEATYHLSRYAHYDWDQGTQSIVFSDSGVAKLVGHVQFIGDVSTKSKTWLWAWDNQTIDTGLTRVARQIRAYGIEHRLRRLVQAQWPATEADGWEMTAFAVRVSNILGAYRSPGRGGPLFIVFTDLRWATPRDSVIHGEEEDR